ncbi:AraC family transcriptional regulator [Salmonella enterica subsp. enterica serovar Goldcoast]|nr:AraC family transcriptional regulator [Salmonella enterica subsp. enterica serovar Goldcoast]
MYHDVSHLLSRLINGPLPLRQIYFASASGPAPELAYQVDFPRLEIVLEGELTDMSITARSFLAMFSTFRLAAGTSRNGKRPSPP